MELVEIITNNGIGVVCVAFMIYFINTSLKQNNEILGKIEQTLVALTSRVSDLEQEIRKKTAKKEK